MSRLDCAENSPKGDAGCERDEPRPRRWRPCAIALAALVLILASPSLALALAVANLGALLILAALQLTALTVARRGRPVAPPPRQLDQPMVTIHVPCCNEPPHVVKRTLDALARLDWDRYEVICLDNNTGDPSLWLPVRDHCRRLGHRFRFYHVDALEGAKAGALELALTLSSPRAEYVAVVDADYCVVPDFLSRALAALSEPGLAFVQFPQAYRNGAPQTEGLTGEYAHYFDVFMPAAQAAGAPLLTGTLSVIRRDALRAVGGWSSQTITEDAELGTRLAIAGHRGRYLPEVVGRGVLPADLDSLRKQRRRWVHGNADTLFRLRPRQLARLGLTRTVGVIAQLSAWFNTLAIPVVVLAVVGIAGLEAAGHRAAATVAGATVLAQLALRALVVAMAPRSTGEPRSAVRSLAADLGLAWEGATGWLEGLVGVRLAFARTSKFELPGSIRDALPALVCAALLALAAIGLAWQGHVVGAVGAGIGALAFAAALELGRQLDTVRDPVAPRPIRSPALAGRQVAGGGGRARAAIHSPGTTKEDEA
jgi:hypothetical protein